MSILFPLDEVVDDWYPADATFEDDKAAVTVVYDIPYSTLQSTLPYILGYAQKAQPGVAGSALQRTIPIAHPVFPWMYATKITKFQPYQFNGADSPAPTSDAPGVGQGLAYQAYAQYNYVRLSVQFEPKTYAVYSDAGMDSTFGGAFEWNRYTTKSVSPRGEAVTMDKGVFVYSSNTNQSVCCGVSKRIGKVDVMWTWHQVPEDGAITLNTGLPTNQLGCLGCVNTFAFAGYPAKTLLLTDIKYIPHNFGVQPIFAVEQSARYYDIEYRMTFFKPVSSLGGFGNWNYLPDFLGGWSQVQTQNSGNPLYSSADFTNLFILN